jgi:hypothetical protein
LKRSLSLSLSLLFSSKELKGVCDDGCKIGKLGLKIGKESKLTIIAHPTSPHLTSPHLTSPPPSLPSPIVVVVVGPTTI